MQIKANERIITALDVSDYQQATALVHSLKDDVGYFKVGMELYYSVGPRVIEMIRGEGCKVFLDLKLHDIPNTVAQAAKALAKTGVDMMNVHVSGGREMMKKTVEAVRSQTDAPQPLLIGVTILTSLDQQAVTDELGMSRSVGEQVKHWALMAKECGLDGVVASPQELGLIRSACGPDFVTVIPGVRPAWSEKNDQKRIMTPAEAIKAGATYLVIGRPITKADDPKHAALKIINEIEEALR
jgi:orotidine-5'-phosphate decarboxylase